MNKGDFINLLKEQDTALEYNCTCLGFREINETNLPLVTLYALHLHTNSQF